MRYLLAVAAALTLASCGSSSSSSIPASTSTSTPATTSSSSSSVATSSTSSTSATTSTVATVPPCRASMLSLSYLGQNGATGKAIIGFALRNTSSQSCHTIGYPGILFLDKNGAGLTTIPTRTTHDFAGPVPLHSLDVAPGASVSFRLGVTHFTANGANTGCTNAFALQVIPPNDTATLRVTIGDGGGYECQTATVSPLQPGTTAWTQ